MKSFVRWSLDESNVTHDDMGPPEKLAHAIGIDSDRLGDHDLDG